MHKGDNHTACLFLEEDYNHSLFQVSRACVEGRLRLRDSIIANLETLETLRKLRNRIFRLISLVKRNIASEVKLLAFCVGRLTYNSHVCIHIYSPPNSHPMASRNKVLPKRCKACENELFTGKTKLLLPSIRRWKERKWKNDTECRWRQPHLSNVCHA